MDGVSRGAVIAFNEAINRRDLQALAGLMTDDHLFVDSAGGRVTGKQAVLNAWEVLPGLSRLRSVCSTEPALDGPAIWTAKTSDGKVSEWRVYEDTTANRQRLGI